MPFLKGRGVRKDVDALRQIGCEKSWSGGKDPVFREGNFIFSP